MSVCSLLEAVAGATLGLAYLWREIDLCRVARQQERR